VLAERTMNINVIGKPVVSISPLTTTVFKGENLTIECTVVQSYSVATSIIWYRDGLIINSSGSSLISKYKMHLADLQMFFFYY